MSVSGYECGTGRGAYRERSSRCHKAQVLNLKERIKRLEDIIDRAANRFFDDGPDGQTAAEMLKILEEVREAKP
jgi:peptidoglycan/xylan/chitin deacetylase (PgdA/CDA1 family)